MTEMWSGRTAEEKLQKKKNNRKQLRKGKPDIGSLDLRHPTKLPNILSVYNILSFGKNCVYLEESFFFPPF